MRSLFSLARPLAAAALVITASPMVGCDDDGDITGGDTSGPAPIEVPEVYEFASSTVEGESSVAYTGQTARQVLLRDLKAAIGGLSGIIDDGSFAPAADGDVIAYLDYWFRFDGESSGDDAHGISLPTPVLQETYGAISTSANLVGKLAGNDSVTDHRDWSTEFAGWTDTTIAQYGGSVDTPEGLIVAMFETLEERAIARANGESSTAFDGTDLPVHVTPEGLDLAQLVQKTLTVGIGFSQGADDYMGDDVDGKGLLASNIPADDKKYSGLEHAWDEAYGYFGLPRDAYDYTAADIAGKGGDDSDRPSGWFDTNADGAIDLGKEYTHGVALGANAAKRDLGATEATDFYGEAVEAFFEGRTYIANRVGTELTDDELDELRVWRDQAISAWEKACAATVIHYINDTLADMAAADAEDGSYSFLDHAKHWGEMKGFAIGHQFNPNSPMLDDFEAFHALVGDAPVLPNAEAAAWTQYAADLVAARDLMRDAFGFSQANAEAW